MLNYLVLGANGFIGRSFCKKLDEQNIDWNGTTRNTSSKVKKNLIRLDFNNEGSPEELSNLINGDTVIVNALGSFKPSDFENEFSSSFRQNFICLENLVKAIKLSPPKKLVHISSAGTVYGQCPHGTTFKEDSPLMPISWYGRSKMFEELFLEHNLKQLEIPLVIARVTNPFGNTSDPKHGFIDVLINKLSKGGCFTAFFDINASRDFIHVDDLSDILLCVCEKMNNGIVNVGTGNSTPLRAILEQAMSLKSEKAKIIVKENINSDVIESKVCVDKLLGIYQKRNFITPNEHMHNLLSENND